MVDWKQVLVMFGVTVASGAITALAIQLATRRLEDHTVTVVRS